MTAFECYKEYVDLKNHFTKPSYDYFKYNGRVKVSLDKFEQRKDRFLFAKLAKKTDLEGFLVANGHADSQKMEHDRDYTIKLFESLGFATPEHKEFKSVAEVRKYIAETPNAIGYIDKASADDTVKIIANVQ